LRSLILMVMVPSLEMSLWVFVWDERDFARMRFG
jgi:hypothetical protein